MSKKIKIVNKDQGEYWGISGGNYRIVLSGEDTADNYAVIEMHVPPGGGPPPHTHPEIQEMFQVLEGELVFKTEEGKFTVKEGGLVNIPFGGAIHCFKNESTKLARLLCIVVPAGLDRLFQKIGVPVQPNEFVSSPPPTPEQMEYMLQFNKKYNQTMYPHDYLD